MLTMSASGAVVAFGQGCARAAVAPAAIVAPAAVSRGSDVPRRPFGSTGVMVSIFGIGGSHLAETGDDGAAERIVHKAIDQGVNFFDNAWEYHDGKSEEILGKALVGRRDKAFLMTKVCTHGRKADVAMRQLEDSLRRLKTDHLDLWQIHECVYYNDPDHHFEPGGVVEALAQAKTQGKVRFVGFTGHKDPQIHLAMLAHDYPFDSVQMPISVFDGQFRSFEANVLPEARRRRMAIIGMKSLGGTGVAVKAGVITAQEGIRYAMSAGVSTTVTGVDSEDILDQNLALARAFTPMTAAEMAALRARVAPDAVDGKYELYKSTVHFDGKVGREQHGMPSQEELPL